MSIILTVVFKKSENILDKTHNTTKWLRNGHVTYPKKEKKRSYCNMACVYQLWDLKKPLIV